MEIKVKNYEIEFIKAYIDAIYFTEDDTEERELCEVFKRECIIDCLAFFNRIECYISLDQIKKAGIDFWLTRNGHGAGFWDGDWPKYECERFIEIAEAFGSVEPILTDY